MSSQLIGKRTVSGENKKTAVYVDGYNLYYGRLRNTPYKWPDLAKGNPRGVNTSLAQHAHWLRRHLQDAELEQALLPAQIATNKKPIRRPKHW